ncbi:hypothetical protein YC2023_002416 [Brassica napus]
MEPPQEGYYVNQGTIQGLAGYIYTYMVESEKITPMIHHPNIHALAGYTLPYIINSSTKKLHSDDSSGCMDEMKKRTIPIWMHLRDVQTNMAKVCDEVTDR